MQLRGFETRSASLFSGIQRPCCYSITEEATTAWRRRIRCFSSRTRSQNDEGDSLAGLKEVKEEKISTGTAAKESSVPPRKRKKRPSKLQRKAIARQNGPDPYDNPTARKILQWSATEKIINAVEKDTLQWIRRVVVGLNLCPFARHPLDENKLRIRVVLDSDSDNVVDVCLREMANLVERDEGTVLIVCPNLYRENFTGYLQVVDVVEQNLVANDWEGILQVAPFHPRFRFEGPPPDAPGDWTNRSPHPTFHLLRENDVSAAARQLGGGEGGGAAAVWSRNVDLLEELRERLSEEEFDAAVRGVGERSSDLRGRLREILRRHRIQLVRASKDEEGEEQEEEGT